MNAAATSLKLLDTVFHSALSFITGDRFCTYHCLLYRKVGLPLIRFKVLLQKQKKTSSLDLHFIELSTNLNLTRNQ